MILPCHAMPCHAIFHRQTSLSYYCSWEGRVMTQATRSVRVGLHSMDVMSCHDMSCHDMSCHVNYCIHDEDWLFCSHTPFPKEMLTLHSFGRPNHHHQYHHHQRKVRWGDEKKETPTERIRKHPTSSLSLLSLSPMLLPPSFPCCYKREIIVKSSTRSKVSRSRSGSGRVVSTRTHSFPVLVGCYRVLFMDGVMWWSRKNPRDAETDDREERFGGIHVCVPIDGGDVTSPPPPLPPGPTVLLPHYH